MLLSLLYTPNCSRITKPIRSSSGTYRKPLMNYGSSVALSNYVKYRSWRDEQYCLSHFFELLTANFSSSILRYIYTVLEQNKHKTKQKSCDNVFSSELLTSLTIIEWPLGAFVQDPFIDSALPLVANQNRSFTDRIFFTAVCINELDSVKDRYRWVLTLGEILSDLPIFMVDLKKSKQMSPWLGSINWIVE